MQDAQSYGIVERVDGGERVFVLSDGRAGLTAEVIPGVGANCHRLRWRWRGETFDLLQPAPSPEALRADPIRFGVPILFPYPNRVAGGAFTFAGRRSRLLVNEPERGNAIHGLVMGKPWRVADAGAGEEDDGGP